MYAGQYDSTLTFSTETLVSTTFISSALRCQEDGAGASRLPATTGDKEGTGHWMAGLSGVVVVTEANTMMTAFTKSLELLEGWTFAGGLPSKESLLWDSFCFEAEYMKHYAQ